MKLGAWSTFGCRLSQIASSISCLWLFCKWWSKRALDPNCRDGRLYDLVLLCKSGKSFLDFETDVLLLTDLDLEPILPFFEFLIDFLPFEAALFNLTEFKFWRPFSEFERPLAFEAG